MAAVRSHLLRGAKIAFSQPSAQRFVHVCQLRKVGPLAALPLARQCSSGTPAGLEDARVEYRNGNPTIQVMLPSRDEKCLFTLRPLTDTVGNFLSMISEEDKGIERIAVYRKDGTKVAKATSVDHLLREDFDIIINDRKQSVTVPVMELSKQARADVERVQDLVGQLYTSMNVSDWVATKESELSQQIERLQKELQPYEQMKMELMAKAEKRTNRLTWLGLGLMGVQFGFLARLTWWEYSWDIMEPVTYFVTYGTTMAMYSYYVLTKQEYLLPEVKDRTFLLHMHKLGKRKRFNFEHYNATIERLREVEEDLRKLRRPLGVSLSQEGAKS